MDTTSRIIRRVSPRRLTLVVGLLAVLAAAPPVGATHTEGILDCGDAGTYSTSPGSANPPGFEAPGPWSGLFLLEGTTSVFRAYSIEAPHFSYQLKPAGKSPRNLVTCTLESSGPAFVTPWTLTGMFVP